MKKFLIIISVLIVSLITLISILVFHNVLWRGSQADCASIQPSSLIEVVKNDYLKNRLPRWDNDKTILETENPGLTFSSPQESDGAFLVPFTATGPKNEIEYFGMVDCKYHTVEYSKK
ncbi:hypothetical protein ACEOXG_001899 [Enterobacter hormaechei]|uniref:YebF family protein n=1 Tax=Enterobacter hormaechei TaxID=158836 RepID=UPI001256CF45|nr:YebF family protein [Enterobacter hormaechei]VAF17058.1 Microcin-M immunity protein [Enterobacter hormaechei]